MSPVSQEKEPLLARWRRWLADSGWTDHWKLRLLALVMAFLVWLFVRLKTP